MYHFGINHVFAKSGLGYIGDQDPRHLRSSRGRAPSGGSFNQHSKLKQIYIMGKDLNIYFPSKYLL